MQISYLREYLELVGYMSFTRAANHLNITQPALSKHIAQLEKEFGTTFFDRSGAKLALTDQGRVFCVEAQKILEAYHQARKNVDEAKNSVHVGGHFEDPTINRYFNAIVNVVSRKNVLTVPIVRQVSALPREDLKHKRIDMYIDVAVPDDDLDGQIYNARVVGSVPFCALMSKNHPLANLDKISAADLDGETIIHPVGEQNRTRGFDIVSQICARHGAKIKKRIVYTQSVLDYSDIAIDREVFIMPQPVLTKQMFPLLDKEYVSKQFVERDMRFLLQMVWRKNNEKPAVDTLTEFIVEDANEIMKVASRSFDL